MGFRISRTPCLNLRDTYTSAFRNPRLSQELMKTSDSLKKKISVTPSSTLESDLPSFRIIIKDSAFNV